MRDYVRVYRENNELLVVPEIEGMPLDRIGVATPLNDKGQAGGLREGMPILIVPLMNYSVLVDQCECGHSQVFRVQYNAQLFHPPRFYVGRTTLDSEDANGRTFPINPVAKVELRLNRSARLADTSYSWGFEEIPKGELSVWFAAKNAMPMEVIQSGKPGDSVQLYLHAEEPCFGSVDIVRRLRGQEYYSRFPVKGFEEMLGKVEKLIS